MPRKRYYRRKRRRNAGYRMRKRRRYRYRRGRRTRSRAQGFASTFVKGRITKMVYHDAFILNSTTGILANQVFRAGSIFDPDFTGTGHQPRGHDQWAQLYHKYLVIGARISVYPSFSTNGGGQPYLFGLMCIRNQTNPYTTGWECIENSGKFRVFRPGAPCRVLRQGYSLRRFYNLKDPRDNIDEYGALFGANPAIEPHFHLWCEGDPGDTIYGLFEVTLEYICILSDAVNFAAS